MNLKRAILFVDSSNVYHSLKQNNIYHKFKYKSFYDSLLSEYDVQKVYFYDAIKSSKIQPEQYSKQQNFHSRLQKEIPNFIPRFRKLKYMETNHRVEGAKSSSEFCEKCISLISEFLKNAGLSNFSREK